MSKRLYSWEEIILSIAREIKAINWQTSHLSSVKLSKTMFMASLAIFIFILWSYDWQLLLATSIGIAIMGIVVKGKKSHWQSLGKQLKQFIAKANRKLVIAVFSGSFCGLSAYLATKIWTNSEDPWLATGSILQGLGTLITWVLLGWLFYIERSKSRKITETSWEKLVNDLTALDPLKRLIAIQKLTVIAKSKKIKLSKYRELLEYFQIMVSQPQEPIIRSTLLDSLDSLGFSIQESQNLPPINLPIKPLPSLNPLYEKKEISSN